MQNAHLIALPDSVSPVVPEEASPLAQGPGDLRQQPEGGGPRPPPPRRWGRAARSPALRGLRPGEQGCGRLLRGTQTHKSRWLVAQHSHFLSTQGTLTCEGTLCWRQAQAQPNSSERSGATAMLTAPCVPQACSPCPGLAACDPPPRRASGPSRTASSSPLGTPSGSRRPWTQLSLCRGPRRTRPAGRGEGPSRVAPAPQHKHSPAALRPAPSWSLDQG